MLRPCYLILGILFFSACGSQKLTNTDLQWNPYEISDKLRFESNDGSLHTVEIVEVERTFERTNPYAGSASAKLEQLVVHCQSSEDNNSGNQRVIYAIGKTSSGDTFANMVLDLPGVRYPGSLYLVSDLTNRDTKRLTINGKQYNDILVLTPENYEHEIEGIIVEKVYWSKSGGYVRYDMSDGTSWTLKP